MPNNQTTGQNLDLSDNLMLKLMKSHRSIRKFTSQDISEELITEMLTCAQSASTSSFLQAYSILLVSPGERRHRLAKLCGDQDYVAQAPVFMVFLADLHRLKKMCENHQQPYSGGWTENLLIATVDAALAAQNTLLAAEALGLGGVYIGGIRNAIGEVTALLQLPEEVYPVFGLCIGYPDQDPQTKERMPLDLLVHKDVYGEADSQVLAAYDERIRQYYLDRTKGKISESWSEGVAAKLSKEMRPHMKDYLVSRGFMHR